MKLRKLLKNLPGHPFRIEPTRQASRPQVYQSLRYGDLKMGSNPLQPVRLQSQNPHCLHGYHQDKTHILQRTRLRLRRTTIPLPNHNLRKTNISIKELWDGLAKLVYLSPVLA